MLGGMTSLCPRCGAYWRCDCQIEALIQPESAGCPHDWSEAVGVDVDGTLNLEEAKVLVCRLCGLYAVEEHTP